MITGLQGIFVKEAVRMRDSGLSYDEGIAKLEEMKETGRIFFTTADISYLKSGGRLGKLMSIANNTLKIKPLILFKDGGPIASGRLDIVMKINDIIGGADIKRTSTLDKEYLAYQLNLYRIGYRQCYGVEWEFLKGIHLKDNIRKFVDIPINEELAWKLINDYLGGNENE